MARTKKEVVSILADRTELSKMAINDVLGSLTDVIVDDLLNGRRFNLNGVGSFRVKLRAARTGRNPRTGETVKIPAKRVVKFKITAPLDRELNI